MNRLRHRYTPPVHYTAEQLLIAEIADLYTDLRCAKRDGLIAYAEAIQVLIDEEVKQRPVEAAQGATMAAKWADEVTP